MSSLPILGLLADKHHKDVFVSECKDGPTLYGSHSRLDAWAMRRSWANPSTFGYEIKYSRNDFMRDEKWRNYLALCSDFFFVTANGICGRDEIPDPAGWMELSKTGGRLFIRKRAHSRDVVIPESLYRYVLMSRAKITRTEIDERVYSDADRLAYWREWLENKAEGADIGRRVSRRVREIVASAETQVTLAKKLYERDAEVRACLLGHGIESNDPSTWVVDRRIADLNEIIPPQFARALDNATRAIAELRALTVTPRVTPQSQGEASDDEG